jgi:threonine/homoserine/homoserine lactone efflux protein
MILSLARLDFEWLFVAIGAVGVWGLIYLSFNKKEEADEELTAQQARELQSRRKEEAESKFETLPKGSERLQEKPSQKDS